MNNNIYLNEEKYKKTNKKIKAVVSAVIFIAILIIAIGIVIRIGSMGIQVPAIGSENWFEMESARSDMSFGGIALIMFGVWLSFIGCIIRFFIGNRREIMAYGVQTSLPIVQEEIKVLTPTVAEAGATMIKTMARAMGEVAKEMSPVYSEIAKGVAEGIKEGLKK